MRLKRERYLPLATVKRAPP